MLTAALFLALFGFDANAKRSVPERVEPVILEGVRYIAPCDYKIVGNEAQQYYVEAWDIKSNQKLWEVSVYTIANNPQMEADVQDVFINSLVIEGDALIVTSEQGKKYQVDLKTKMVKRIK